MVPAALSQFIAMSTYGGFHVRRRCRPLASAHAEAVTLGALAVTTVVAAACALPLVRTGR
jgi:hypothetical protein